MHSQTYLAAACALLSAVAAQPAPGMDTVTHIDYVTEMVTSTVWVDAGDPRANQTPAPIASVSKAQNDVQTEHQSHSHGGAHSHGHESSASSSVHVVASPPAVVAPSSSSSVFIPPPPPAVTPSTSSSAVPPPPPPPASTSSTSVVVPAPVPVETHATQPTTAAAPVPTTSTAAANNPAQQVPSSSPAAATTTATGTESGSSPHYSNVRLTFYDPKGYAGSCGWPISKDDMMVAISAINMGKSGKAALCGKKITIKYNGKTSPATIADTCTGCPENGLDLTSTDMGASAGEWRALVSDNGDQGHVETAEWWFD